MKPLKRKSNFGRPQVYPDLRVIMKEFAVKEKSFDQKSWEVTETQRKIVLHGKYNLKKEDGTLKEQIPFMVLLPKFDPEPKKNALIMFNRTNHLRYITAKYKIRETLEGIYYEVINK